MSILKKNWNRKSIVNLTVSEVLLSQEKQPCPGFTIKTKGDHAVMAGICAVFRQQTEGEKIVNDAVTLNDRGFSASTAPMGSELAKWMTMGRMDGVLRRPISGVIPKWKPNPSRLKAEKAGRPFRGKRFIKNESPFAGQERVEVCRQIAQIHAGQLADIANGRL